MARQSNTSLEYHCKYCGEWIRSQEYVTWGPANPGVQWHYNCINTRLDPDVHGFPSRKNNAYCAMDYQCKRPHGSTWLNKGDMIKGVGPNKFAHIECTRSNNDIPATPTYNPVAAESTVSSTVQSDSADDETLNAIIAALAEFIAKNQITITEIRAALQELRQRADASDIATTALTDTVAAIQSTIADLQERRPIQIVIHQNNGSQTTQDMGYQHKQFSMLMRQSKLRDNDGYHINTLVAGPAGSGKSTAAKMIAQAMGLHFYVQGICLTQYELIGHEKPHNGTLSETAFYHAFTKGGVLLADELDAWDAKALLKLNGALANGICDFPNGNAIRHKDCVIIGAANTWGHGGDSNFVGRNKLDATSKDRFLKISWPYDESHERHIVGQTSNELINAHVDRWVTLVQEARHAAQSLGAFVVISPRASLSGAMMIRSQDFTNEEIVSSIFGDLRDPKTCPTWSTIGRAIEEWAKSDIRVEQAA